MARAIDSAIAARENSLIAWHIRKLIRPAIPDVPARA
jgi:hypothetical protein